MTTDNIPADERYIWADPAAALLDLAQAAPIGLRPLMLQAADRIATLKRENAELRAKYEKANRDLAEIIVGLPRESHEPKKDRECNWVEIEEGSGIYNTCELGQEFHLEEGLELYQFCQWCGGKITTDAEPDEIDDLFDRSEWPTEQKPSETLTIPESITNDQLDIFIRCQDKGSEMQMALIELECYRKCVSSARHPETEDRRCIDCNDLLDPRWPQKRCEECSASNTEKPLDLYKFNPDGTERF